jgi:hypothetical protein
MVEYEDSPGTWSMLEFRVNIDSETDLGPLEILRSLCLVQPPRTNQQGYWFLSNEDIGSMSSRQRRAFHIGTSQLEELTNAVVAACRGTDDDAMMPTAYSGGEVDDNSSCTIVGYLPDIVAEHNFEYMDVRDVGTVPAAIDFISTRLSDLVLSYFPDSNQEQLEYFCF